MQVRFLDAISTEIKKNKSRDNFFDFMGFSVPQYWWKARNIPAVDLREMILASVTFAKYNICYDHIWLELAKLRQQLSSFMQFYSWKPVPLWVMRWLCLRTRALRKNLHSLSLRTWLSKSCSSGIWKRRKNYILNDGAQTESTSDKTIKIQMHTCTWVWQLWEQKLQRL